MRELTTGEISFVRGGNCSSLQADYCNMIHWANEVCQGGAPDEVCEAAWAKALDMKIQWEAECGKKGKELTC